MSSTKNNSNSVVNKIFNLFIRVKVIIIKAIITIIIKEKKFILSIRLMFNSFTTHACLKFINIIRIEMWILKLKVAQLFIHLRLIWILSYVCKNFNQLHNNLGNLFKNDDWLSFTNFLYNALFYLHFQLKYENVAVLVIILIKKNTSAEQSLAQQKVISNGGHEFSKLKKRRL